jgi:aminoglycoside phosphotransferase (APT) family kinase protein
MPSPVDISPGEEAAQALRNRGYNVEEYAFRTGRPDGRTYALRTRAGLPAVAKILPADRAERTFRNMEQVWRSSFGARRNPPGLPQPLECLPEIGAVICERLDGRPLVECGAVTERALEGAMRLLAGLHSCDAAPETERSARRIVRSARRKAERVAELAPQYAPSIREVVRRLELRRPKDTELVPSHGDFSPRNVLRAGDRLVLIDWDRFQAADPARDVAYFGIFPWRAELRGGHWPDRAALKRAVKLYESFRPGATLRKQLRFHVAAGLVRTACSLVQLWPQEAWLVPALAGAALRELEAE